MFVYLVDPSTRTEYYIRRMVVIPIFDYQSGNAPQIFDYQSGNAPQRVEIQNPFMRTIFVARR